MIIIDRVVQASTDLERCFVSVERVKEYAQRSPEVINHVIQTCVSRHKRSYLLISDRHDHRHVGAGVV